MSKKKTRSARRRRRSAPQIASALTASYRLLTAIVIETGNAIIDPDPLDCLSGAPLVWLVYNRDSVRHVVEIDPGTFKRKDTGKHEHPFPKSDKFSVTVDPQKVKLIVADVKPNATPEQYKYSITSYSPNGTSVTLDPDFDVVDPGSLI